MKTACLPAAPVIDFAERRLALAARRILDKGIGSAALEEWAAYVSALCDFLGVSGG